MSTRARETLAGLEAALADSLESRRKHFLIACTYSDLSSMLLANPKAKPAQVAMLDEALDKFNAYSTAVKELRLQIHAFKQGAACVATDGKAT